MRVELVAHTPDPEGVVAAAARLCYSAAGIPELRERQTPEQVDAFLALLRQAGHLSPLEHASFTLYLEGFSRVTTHQLVRHRVASYSQQSQRYVRVDGGDFVLPPSVGRSPAARAEFLRALEAGADVYRRLLKLGIPREDARYCLPQAVASRLVVTMNARQLLHFFQLRTCRRAQWEIRCLALLMLRRVRQAAPGIFRLAGPDCQTEGICRQGKYSCGRLERLAARGRDEPGTD